MRNIVVAVTGASGVVYGLRVIGELLGRGFGVDLIVSPTGRLLLKEEAGLDISGVDDVAAAFCALLKDRGYLPAGAEAGRLVYSPPGDFTSAVASGSALRREMVIVPCSMGTIGRLASGISRDLIDRAADCVLKEMGSLVLVPRETPLNQIHLENMLRLSRAGAVIAPAMPAFYTHPATIDDMVDFIAGKVLDLLGIENDLYKRWTGTSHGGERD